MISVIVTVHNESQTLRGNVMRLRKSLDALGREYEIILAEDGSTDGSGAVAQALRSKTVRILSSAERLGKGRAISNAIAEAKGDIVVQMDADLSTDLSALGPLVLEVENGTQLCIGSRLMPGSRVHGRGVMRETASRWYNRLVGMFFQTSIHDHQCGFKAFKKAAVAPLLPLIKDEHWFWDTELLVKAHAKGLRIVEIPVIWSEGPHSNVRLCSDAIYMGLAAVRLRLGV
jgi:glycosyltransferase involved in cell wall biosynthesis